MENEKIIQSLFSKLYAIDVSDYIETKKNGNVELTYLSWANAWKRFKEECPSAQYIIKHWDGKPYLYDEDLGYMVETTVYADGEEHSMWLPVMDNTNHAMKDKPYTYKTSKGEERTVAAATMFDINTAIMRCLVKNIGMFGLGLYIYAGEDVPDGETVRQGSKARFEKPSVEDIIDGINEKMTLDNWKKFYAKAIGFYAKGTPEYTEWIAVFDRKKKELSGNMVKAELKEDEDFLNDMVNDVYDA